MRRHSSIDIAITRWLPTATFSLLWLLIVAALSYWIWMDRANRAIPGAGDLVELRGVASHPDLRSRAHAVRFQFQSAGTLVDGRVLAAELQIRSTGFESIAALLADDEGPIPVVVLVVRAELGRGPREEPASVLQLRVRDSLILPLESGLRNRAEQAADARMNAWIAVVGIGIVSIAMGIHWFGVLRRRGEPPRGSGEPS